VISTATTDWLGSVGTFVGPFVGVLGALWLYAKRTRDDEARRAREQLEAVYVQLRAELDANRRIVMRSIETIEAVLRELPSDHGSNDTIHDERLYLAPLFMESWAALTRTDAHREVPRAELDRLITYYTAVARANWLIQRVQRFQFRAPILEQILGTLQQVQDPKAGLTVDLESLQRVLAPRLTPA
jgi:hypothetical protein